MYQPCSFNRNEYLNYAADFEALQLDYVDSELCEFDDDPESLARELAYTRYALAKLEKQVANPETAESGAPGGANLTLAVHPVVREELERMVLLHRWYGAPAKMESLEDLVAYILATIADGSRRPGSWERQLLIPMGLVADTQEHEVYRPSNPPDPGTTLPGPEPATGIARS